MFLERLKRIAAFKEIKIGTRVRWQGIGIRVIRVAVRRLRVSMKCYGND